VWVRTQGMDLFPNLYLILVGPPGVGKSVVLSQSERLLRAIPDIVVAPSNVSSASLIDTLSDAKRRIVRPAAIPNYLEYNAVIAVASELGVFLPTYEPAFMNLLTKVYDGEPIEDRKRTRSVNVKIDKPILSLLSGTTPSYLNSLLPEGAWDQGFTSRSIPVYSGDRVILNPFQDEAFDRLEKLYGDLLYDIKSISTIVGRVNFESDASDAIIAWHSAGGPPVPEHGKLLHYIPRRTAHVLKLCIIAAVSRGGFVITLEDFERARGWLLEAENYMPEIFKAMISSPDGQMMDEVWEIVWKYWTKNKKAIPERMIVNYLGKRVPHHAVMRLIELMVRGGKIEPVGTGIDGKSMFKPGPKDQETL